MWFPECGFTAARVISKLDPANIDSERRYAPPSPESLVHERPSFSTSHLGSKRRRTDNEEVDGARVEANALRRAALNHPPELENEPDDGEEESSDVPSLLSNSDSEELLHAEFDDNDIIIFDDIQIHAGNVIYEYQLRGSPHAHINLWRT